MCLPFSPPGFFDLTTLPSSSLVLIFGFPLLVLLLLLPLAFWSSRRTSRRIPPSQERRSLFWLQALGTGCILGGWVLLQLNSLWGDALSRSYGQWVMSLSGDCSASIVKQQDYFYQLSHLQSMLYGGASLLFIVGAVLGVLVGLRSGRMRSAMRQPDPEPSPQD